MQDRLKEIINDSRLSNRKFSKAIGLSENAISEILNGRSNLTPDSIIIIRAKFNVSPTWLLTGEGSMFIGEKNDAGINANIHNSTIGEYNFQSLNNLDLNKDEQVLIQKFRKTGYMGLHKYIKKILNLGLIFLTIYKTIEYIMM